MKKRVIISAVAAVLVLTLSCIVKPTLERRVLRSPIAESYAVNPVENPDLNRRAGDVASKLSESIPESEFGGVYLDGDTVYVNIVESSYSKFKDAAAVQDGVKVVYNPVKFSLGALQAATDSIFARLNESEQSYDIITADANDMTNKIDIEIRPASDEVYEIAAEYIDLEHVNVTVLPDDYRLDFVTANELPQAE